ncbi:MULTISPECIES: thioredoxin family protein [Methanosarcina]|uniref:Thioredoxin n=3 Tax=Methanosarcina barkeri TaxID=2208 RepID=A0A0E3LN82_METBA|nr:MULTISPECIES: thioredoxin family protein [Methanosarcina]AKB54316.1 Thioredoxin [Methanosarcina barkeri MS]AKB57605.1 Thioredoxin [Methanosarcina barkeri 227]AKJ38156.1 thioredoxin [Methanosarcina barkeri CM1]OED08409.1 thioredoxin [Methanosarcina sp. A14]
MKQLVILSILIIAVLFTAGCTEPNSTQESHDNGYVVNTTELGQINTSLEEGPVFLKLGAEWCGPCQKMEPILQELANKYEGKATIMSVDIDQSPEFIEYFGVNSIPDSCVIIGIENGEYVYMQEAGNASKDRFTARILGLRDEQEFEKVLDLALQKEKVKSK